MAVGRIDDLKAVTAALRTLSSVHREAILLAYFDGMTHTQIVAHLTCPLGTVKSRIRDGLITMRQSLAGDILG